MVDFSYSSYAVYRLGLVGDTPTFLLQTTVNEAGTIPDLGNDDTFSEGDAVFNFTPQGQATTTLPYLDVIDIDGTLYPMFGLIVSVSPNLVVFIDRSNVTPPATIDPIFGSQPYSFCFGPDTAIATPDGARVVSELAMGDCILAADGHAVAVKWIGRQDLIPAFMAETARPVYIEAGALGDSLPERDLIVTPEHALAIDGVMITAGALVNGSTVRHLGLAEMPHSLTVYHIETEGHAVILAEGQPAETFIDYAGRKAFDNYSEFEALFPEKANIPEIGMPRISAARQVPAPLKARLGLESAKGPAAA